MPMPTLLVAQVVCGNMGKPTATVIMKGPDGVVRTAGAVGAGPVDAVFKVGTRALGSQYCCGAAASGWVRSAALLKVCGAAAPPSVLQASGPAHRIPCRHLFSFSR